MNLIKKWCILHSRETESYNNNLPPRQPWQGIVHDGIIFQFNEKDQIDEDTNASAYCSPTDLFDTKEEADVAYKEELKKYINDAEKELNNLRLLL